MSDEYEQANTAVGYFPSVTMQPSEKPMLYKVLRNKVKSPLKVFVQAQEDFSSPYIFVHIYGDQDHGGINFNYRQQINKDVVDINDISYANAVAEWIIQEFKNYILSHYIWED